MDQQSSANTWWRRQRLFGWISACIAMTGGYFLAQNGLGCGRHESQLAASLSFATVFAVFSGIGTLDGGIVGVVLALPVLQAWGNPRRDLPNWILWIAALILIPLAAYGVGRLFRRHRPLPTDN